MGIHEHILYIIQGIHFTIVLYNYLFLRESYFHNLVVIPSTQSISTDRSSRYWPFPTQHTAFKLLSVYYNIAAATTVAEIPNSLEGQKYCRTASITIKIYNIDDDNITIGNRGNEFRDA